MTESMGRRRFLGAGASAAAATLGLGAGGSAIVRPESQPPAARPQESAGEKIVVGIMGMGTRGPQLAKGFLSQPNVEVAYVCDVDSQRAGKAVDSASKASPKAKAPKAVGDFRRILDDQDVDVLVVATCNHWHAPAAILGCQAGKHVYVEKPCSYNPREGELLVEAARKHKRMVQMGNQRRSWANIMEPLQQIREGAIGRAYLAQSWYFSNRGSIGKGKEAEPPKGLDYALWEGPAPHKPFHDNYLHYNWHWFWHWGNGELGNNGVHSIDVCRWGLGVGLPSKVVSSGGRYHFQDDQQTPDTHIVSFDYDDRKSIVWQGLSCNQMPKATAFEIAFLGDQGSVSITDRGYSIHDLKGKEIRKVAKNGEGEGVHVANFLAAVRGEAKLNSEIAEGHASTMLCHLGNIAHRTGRTLHCDPGTGRILNDAEAMTYWSREYDPKWEPKV